jgi:endo-1,4-beta-xylanase
VRVEMLEERRLTGKRKPVLIVSMAAFAVAGATITVVHAPPSGAATTLGSAAAEQGRIFGTAVAANLLAEQRYADVLDREFTGATPENEMKWDATEPTPGTFRFAAADAIVGHARGQGMVVRGHTLVWHQQLPSYVNAITSATALRQAMNEHIAGVAGHYQGQLNYWDVVNEAFVDDGSRRGSVFQQVIGDGYIEEAFAAAHRADPEAKLCYNDFSAEGVNAKSTAIFNMVRDFKARGVPIDCVGFQSHFIAGQIPADLRANLQRFADLGVEVQITELDIRLETPPSQAGLRTQADDYATVVGDCLAVARCTSITVWQISDRDSWIPGTFPGQGAALLFDEDFARKPAYDAALAALES